jgi:hypothetical protein
LSPYVSAYTSSIHWLASFVPKPGQSLSAPYWGKIASIGGSPIAPSGSAKVTIPAGTFDTKVVSWHKGVDNNIWISPNLPYPVKAQTFADVTTGNPPIQYAFDLIAKGQGKPPIPKSQIEIPKPPLTIQTARGTYYITLVWEPQVIKAGADTKFGVVFKDNSQHTISQVSYSFKVTDSSGTVLKDVKDQKAPDGTGSQTVKFEKSGPGFVLISIDAVAGQPSGIFVENARFRIVVATGTAGAAGGGEGQATTAANLSRQPGQTNQTNVTMTTTNTSLANTSSPATVPEFPLNASSVALIAAIIGVVVFMTRTKRFRMGLGSGFRFLS